jgi:hypothetical protein
MFQISFIEINIEIKLLITEMNNTKHPYKETR